MIKNKDNLSQYYYNYPLIVFLMGPTASGKTRLVMDLYEKKINIKVISVDSALVYKGMNIGTAKPSSSELKYVPHKLIDIRDPFEYYSVADFYHDAIFEIKNIVQSGYIPLLVGGTMLYFKVLLKGLFDLPKVDCKIRDSLKYEAQKIGWMSMYNKLKCIDPVTSNRIHWNDHKRILRALEVFLISGKTRTELEQQYISNNDMKRLQYQVLQFAIMPSTRMILYRRIEERFYRMLETGFENEVNILFNRFNFNQGTKSFMSCVGYRQMWEYLSRRITYEEMIHKGISATKRLAKQQLTWLRHWPDNLFCLNSDHISSSVDVMLKVLSKVCLSHQTLFRD